MSFEKREYAHATKLASYIWNLKNQNKTYKIKWKIIRKLKPVKSGDAKCSLCLNEKFEIAMTDGKRLINQKNELLSKCVHVSKFMLNKA